MLKHLAIMRPCLEYRWKKNHPQWLISPASSGSPSDEQLQHRSSSVTAFFRIKHLLQRGILHGLQTERFSTGDLWGLHGLSLPSRHGLKWNGCSGLSDSFLMYLGVGVWLSLSLYHTHYKKRGNSQNKRSLLNRFPLFHMFICRGADWFSPGWRRGQLAAKKAFLKLLTAAMPAAPSPTTKPSQTQTRHIQKENSVGLFENLDRFVTVLCTVSPS